MPRPKYENAVAWIANNDEEYEMNVDVLAQMISVALVADLWGYDPLKVARAVVRYRSKSQQ